MKVTTKWLKEFVDFQQTPDELAELLAMSGTEVESIIALGVDLKKVVVGRIESVEPHPNADRLTYCNVEVPGGPAHIVCGAKNIAVGQKVPVALPGAKLPNGMEIKKSKLRGVVSEGMMCSAAELGISEEASGILVLPDDTPVGASVGDLLGLEDHVLELEITPNRPDCMSVIGIAREVAALTGGKLRYPTIEPGNQGRGGPGGVEVIIEDPELCDRYVARLVKNVKIGPSPPWLSRRIEACGIRAINNVVDVTNYVLLEMGQPLHAFDYALLKGGKIVVRTPKAGEKLITIDHVTRSLEPGMLIIADARHPIALAGVMGGFDTEISEKTTDVLIESAAFQPASIRKTSRSLGLISESSLRFEKGVDVESVARAADRAAQLMAEVAGADISTPTVESYPRPWSRPTIHLRSERASQVLGVGVDATRVKKFLESLELEVEETKEGLAATPPGFRRDLEREIDLIEEVARLYGLNNLPSRVPAASQEMRGFSPTQEARRKASRALRSAGLDEVLTYSFISEAAMANLGLEKGHPWINVVRVSNPLSEEQAVMRPSLWPGLITTAVTNINRGNNNLALFEQGSVFFDRKNEEPLQLFELGLLLSGASKQWGWYSPARELDFYDMKGLLELLMQELHINDYHFTPALHAALAPGITAELVVGERAVGVLGRLHPSVQDANGLRQSVFLAQIEIDALIDYVGEPHFREIAKFPAVEMDLALVVDESLPAERIENIIKETAGKLLKELRVFDVYRGKGIEKGKKSLAFSLKFQSSKRTLTDEEVAGIMERIISAAEKKAGAAVRT